MFRAGSRNGLWMASLLPLAMLNDPVILVALSTTIYSIFYALDPNNSDTDHDAINKPITKNKFNSMVAILSTMIALLSFSSFVSMLACFTTFLAFVFALPKIFSTFHASFSYGEGVLVLQGIVVFMAKLLINITQDVHDPSTIAGSFNIIANVGLGSIGGLCLLHFFPLKVCQHPSTFYLSGFSILFGVTLPVLFSTLKRNPIAWTLQTIFASNESKLLLLLWCVCTLLALHIVAQQDSGATTTITRKYFHFLVVVVFTSGVMVNRSLLYLASIVGLSVMILLEHMRYAKIQPVANIISAAFKTFQDKNDRGDLILTNIYLLVGVSLPLWLTPDLEKADPLLLLSGVLSIGIGDSFASIFGSKFGRTIIPQTQKSVEGMMASILAQLVFVKALNMELNLVLVAGICAVSIVETLTTQVDNLVLPFVMYIVLKHAPRL
eukprot:11154.XXX_4445_3071_1 [CDS] Oithona nana genome sequencing.